MTILDKIIKYKREEVAKVKKRVSVKELMSYRHFDKKVPSLKDYLLNHHKTGIIAEHKRRSPSKGIINNKVNIKDVVKEYEKAGSSAVSVLTDSKFFGGSNEDLTIARDTISIPILRKDFIVDTYQIYESKAIGASAILLIAAVLTPEETKEFGSLANYLGMEVFMEFHNEAELSRMNSYTDVAGINNRNLNTFEVDLNKSIELADKLSADIPKVAESGIGSVEDFVFLQSKGFSGFLIGENFMKSEDPGKACKEFSDKIIRND